MRLPTPARLLSAAAAALCLLTLSCSGEYCIVEMAEQVKGTVLKLNYDIETTMGAVTVEFRDRQKIYSIGRVTGGSLSSMGSRGHGDMMHRAFYSPADKRIVVYFYYLNYDDNQTIDSPGAAFSVEPFDNFEGFYRAFFVYDNNQYEIVSVQPEMKIQEMVRDFDYERLIATGISQCRMTGPWIDTAKEQEKLNNGRFFTGYTNYIFPEDINPSYTILSSGY